MADFSKAIPHVLKYEGGYQASPNDSGNFYNGKLIGTNRGITPNAYFAAYKKVPTIDTIKAITPQMAQDIYKRLYWDKIPGNGIKNDSVALLMLDTVVNSGTAHVKTFKMVANLTAGKKIMAETATPLTSVELDLLNSLPQKKYFDNLKGVRESFYKKIASDNPKNAVFLQGWLNRLNKHKFSGDSNNNIGGGTSFGLVVGFGLMLGSAVLLNQRLTGRWLPL